MSFPVVCPECGARLKLPPGAAQKKARCPRCNGRVDLTAALDAVTYRPAALATVEAPEPAAAHAETRPSSVATTESRDDPPPDATPSPVRLKPPPLPAPEREEDPLPYADLNPTARRRSTDTPSPPLTLAEDPAPPAEAPAAPAAPPFRAAARVTADSSGSFSGPCGAVLVEHGLFLESVPYRPFLYAPVGSPVEAAGRRGLTVTLPDGRTVTFEVAGRDAARVAADAVGLLAGERGVPDPREYRRTPRWLFGLAAALAGGVAAGPLVLARAADLGSGTGLLLGVGFAAAGLAANAAVVLLTRLSAAAKVGTMAGAGAVVTGVFLLAAGAYLAGRRDGFDRASAALPGPVPAPSPKPPDPKPPEPPPPSRRPLPTAVDAAYRDGVYRFEDGPAEATAVGVTPDGAVMLVGYRNGTTRVWRFDQPTIDPFAPGPRADGPVTAVRFDAHSALAYLSCPGGAVAAHWNDPPEGPVKIPGEPFAAFTAPAGERFAAVRSGVPVVRSVPAAALRRPGPKFKGVATLDPKDETEPADLKVPPTRLDEPPTFLAWHPTGLLLAGQKDGTVLSWGPAGPRPTVVGRHHKAPVRAWAASPGSWDFATGDDDRMVGLWADRSTTPTKMFVGAGGPVTQLSFSPSGSHLAVLGGAGVVWVWDLHAMRVVVKATRPTPTKLLAFGPDDDLILLGDGKSLELWHLGELAKQP